MRGLLLLVLALNGLFAAAVGLARAAAYDEGRDTLVQAALTAFADCPRPCFMGLAPGMSVIEAERALRAHPWAHDVEVQNTRITWAWTGAQPAFIDTTVRGAAHTYWDFIRAVTVATDLRYGDLLLAADPPLNNLFLALTGSGGVNHLLFYPDFVVHRLIDCPFRYGTLFHHPLEITLEWRRRDAEATGYRAGPRDTGHWWGRGDLCAMG